MSDFYLIVDEDQLKTIKLDSSNEITIISLGSVDSISSDLFMNNGFKIEDIEHLFKIRYSLNSDKPKVLKYSNGNESFSIKEEGVPFGEFIEMKSVIDLSAAHINFVKSINITATLSEFDTIKFILSNDSGLTWNSFYNGAWIKIFKTNAELISKGMDLSTINSLTENELKALTENVDNIKIGWYMSKNELDSNCTISHIELTYNTNL